MRRRMEFAKRRMLETEDIVGSLPEVGRRDLSHLYPVFKGLESKIPLAFIVRHALEAEGAE